MTKPNFPSARMTLQIASFSLLVRSLLVAALLIGIASGSDAARTKAASSSSSPRQLLPLSGPGWKFFGAGNLVDLPDIASPDFASAHWTDVSVPHIFQTRTDLSLDHAWYERQINVTPALSHKRLYLVFEGAASIADVYVNGKKLGEHRGAYTRFIFDATDALHAGAGNVLAVNVDNRHQSTTDCLPSVSGLYTVWGGLYRHVWLLATNDLQIDPTYYASPGVFITPTLTSLASGSVNVKVLLRNTSSTSLPADVKATILDPSGSVAATLTGHADVASQQQASVELTGVVANPLVWTPETPNLYHVKVDVLNAGAVTDSITQPLGFHTLAWDFKSGLMTLNGKPYTLYGCDLHQEIESKQSAVEPEDLIPNFDSLKELGANWVRLAHYPRAQFEYDLCDGRGIFCWSENGHSHNDVPNPTADTITTEMVEQNYNHPSIIVWSVGNEGNAAPSEREVPVVKALDTTRPVMVANMACANADYRAKNTYPGWYGPWRFDVTGLISEIGAGGVVTTHTDYAAASHKVDSFEPEEYQQLVAETDFEQAFRQNNGKLGMFTWWVLRDFNDVKYKVKIAPLRHGINSKGLETYGGFKKDVYYLYRSFLRPDTPTLHITSKLYYLRQGAVDNGIKVYSNASSVTLMLNGQTVSTIKNGEYKQNNPQNTSGITAIDNVFYWPAPLHTGKNVATVTDNLGNTDTATIYFYGPNGLPELPAGPSLISDLASSNPTNPAYYMDMPVQAEWPVYYDFDSTADNSLDAIPSQAAGAAWIALHRVTKPGYATDISFKADSPLTVYVICTKEVTRPDSLLKASFKPVATSAFKWRGDDLIPVDAELYSQHANAGQHLDISLGDRDAMVLVKRD